jgi:hypothetical protein
MNIYKDLSESKEIMDEMMRINLDQISVMLNEMILKNVERYKKILSSHGVSDEVLKAAYAQYIHENNITGIPIPKSKKSSLASKPRTNIGNSSIPIDKNIISAGIKPITSKELNIDLDHSWVYKGFRYRLTDMFCLDNILACVDLENKIVLGWDTINNTEYEFNHDDIKWFKDNGYEVSNNIRAYL